jgi:hypothetical protein
MSGSAGASGAQSPEATQPSICPAPNLGQSGDELTERKLAELYEKLGRVMVERDFLLRKSSL